MNPDDLNLRHLRAFCEVAACGSISAASKRVHLSQPAITQALAKLERALATPLFVRSSSGMVPTETGKLIERRSRRALDFIRAGAQSAQANHNGRKGGGFMRFDKLLTGGQLRALLAVAKAGNFSLAARSVGVSQPSLHRLARDLERLSGVELFVRTARGIDLTPSAEALARHARLAFAELQQGFEELDAARGIDSARLHVASLPLARTSILPLAINALARLRPDVGVRAADGSYDDLLRDLRHGEVDILIGALRAPLPIDDVVQIPLFDDRLAIVGRKGHPLAGRRRVSVRDLARFPWVVPRPGPPTRAQFEALFAKAGIAVPKGLVEASSLMLIRGLLTDSDRLTLVSEHQVQPEIRQGLLESLAFDLAHTARPIGVTVRRDWQPTATQRLFLELLRGTSAAAARGGGYSDSE